MFNARHDKERGTLTITASNEGRAELADAYRRGGYRYAEQVIAEGLHEAYEPWDADDAPDAWLCSAPFMIDCDGISYPDNGERVVYAGTPVFYFPNYVVEDQWETLKNTGRVVWTQVIYDTPDPLSIAEMESYLPGGSREGQAVWIDPARFPDATDDQILKAWPELVGEYESDRLDPGLYFWKNGNRYGPYATSPTGVLNAEKAGMIPRPRDPNPPKDRSLFEMLDDWRGDHYEKAAA